MKTVQDFLKEITTSETEVVELSFTFDEGGGERIDKIDSVCLYSYHNDEEYVRDSSMDYFENLEFVSAEIRKPVCGAGSLGGICDINIVCRREAAESKCMCKGVEGPANSQKLIFDGGFGGDIEHVMLVSSCRGISIVLEKDDEVIQAPIRHCPYCGRKFFKGNEDQRETTDEIIWEAMKDGNI